jgi:hypothetical protein
MAAAKPSYAKRCPLEQTKFVNRFGSIDRTTREETTCFWQEWRDKSMIDSQDAGDDVSKES